MNPDKPMPNKTHENPNLPSAPPDGSWPGDAELIAAAMLRVRESRQPPPQRVWAPIFWPEAEAMLREIQAYREGGITEEILRRNDGYVKVGRGCVLAVATNVPAQQRREEPLT